MFNGKNILEYVTSFSKIITVVWIAIWVETILFTQLATIFNFGDVTAIQYLNDNVVQIGIIVCGFYFCTKTIENVAQGIETHLAEKACKIKDCVEEIVEEGCTLVMDEVVEPTPIQNVEEDE